MNRDGELPRGTRPPSRPESRRPLLSTEPNQPDDGEPTVGLFDPDAPVRSMPGPRSSAGAGGARPARNRLGAGVLGSGPETARPITRPVPTVNLGGPSIPPSDPATTGNFPPGTFGALNPNSIANAVGGPDPLPVPVFERMVDGVYRLRTLVGIGLAAVITIAVVAVYRNQTPNDDVVAGAGSGAESRSALVANAERTTTTIAATTTSGESDVDSAVDSVSSTDDTDAGSPPAGPQSSPTTTVPTSASSAGTATTLASSSTSDPASSSSTETTIDPSSTTSDPTTTTTDPDATTTSTDPGTTTDPNATTSTTASTTTSTTESSTTLPPTVTVEAEAGTMLGTARVRTDHLNFNGSGFVGDIISEGSGVTLTIDAVGGDTPFTVRYSAGPDNGPPGPRTIGVLVNGIRITEAQMRLTTSWDEWDIVTGTIPLNPGQNSITLIQEAGDTGWVNIDSVQLY